MSHSTSRPVSFRRIFWRAALGACCWLGGLLFTGCAPRSAAPADAVLRIAQRNEPADLDPARATLPDEFFIIRALSEGLVTPAPDGGTPLPAAAKRWEISDDGLTWTFHLRQDATWSNGEPVTARDFVASYRRVLTPATAAPKAALFFLVRGAQDFYRGHTDDFGSVGFHAANDHTLIVTLAQPAPHFLAYAASGPWIPVHAATVERHGRQWTRPENFVGNGPFVLKEWRPKQRIAVQRRADYWDATAVKLDGIHFLAFDHGDAEERAFRAGQIDVTMAVPQSKIAAYAAESSPRLRQVPLHETRYLAINTQRGPLTDARVRQALSLALDRSALVNHVLQGSQTVARHYVPEGLGGFHSAVALTENIGEAQALLASAGFPGGAGFPVLELTGWTQTPVLEAVQAMWKQNLGIQVNIALREARVHQAALNTGDYDIGFMTAIPDVADPANLLDDFRTGASGNYAQWSDPTLDELLDTAAAEPDADGRLQRLAAAEARMLAKAPLAPLYFNRQTFLVAPRVRGWQADALWTRFYKDVTIAEP